MAPFNPSIPQENAPFYLSLSKPISPYEGDKSKGIALAGIGNLLKEGVSAADDIVKGFINSGMRQDLTKERDAETARLENMVGGGNVTNDPQQPASPEAPKIIPGSVAEPIPSELQKPLDRTIGSIASARSFRPEERTYYLGRYDAIVKDYKNRFPGYADYIEQRATAITGDNPANARIKELIATYTALGTEAKGERDKALKYVIDRPNYDGQQDMLQYIYAGGDPIKAYQWGHEMDAQEADRKLRAAKLADFKGTQEERAIQANIDLGKDNEKSFSNMWSTAVTTKFGAQTPQQMNDLSLKIMRGEEQVGDENGLALLQAMKAARKTAFDTGMARASQPGPNGTPSKLTLLGKTATENSINASLYAYDTTIDLLENKEYGAAFMNANRIKASQSDMAIRLQNSPNEDVRKFTRLYPAVKSLVGDQGVATILQRNAIGQNIGDDIMNSVDVKKMEVVTGQSTLNDAFKYLYSREVGVGPGKENERGAYNELLSLPERITDPKMSNRGKDNIIKYSFGPGNEGLVSNLQPDQIDPKTGNVVPGKTYYFSRILNPAVIDEAWNAGKRDSNLWIYTKNFANREFAKIFTGQVRDLDTIASNPDYRLTYNTDNPLAPYWKVEMSGRPGPGYGTSKANLISVQYRLDVLNKALGTMAYIANKEGGNINTTLATELFNMNPVGEGVASKMIQSLITEGMPPVKSNSKGTKPRSELPSQNLMQFQSQKDTSLESFLMNPNPTETQSSTDSVIKAAAGTKRTAGLNSDFKEGLAKAISDYKAETGNSVKLSSLVRTRAEQAKAYANYQAGGGLAAPPGHSRHEVGEAADVNNDPKFLKWLQKQDLKTYNLEFLPERLRKVDPGHIQYRRQQVAQ